MTPSPHYFKAILAVFVWILLTASDMIFVSGPIIAAEEIRYDAHGKRDPFVSLVTTKIKQVGAGLVNVESVDDLNIQGLIFDIW